MNLTDFREYMLGMITVPNLILDTELTVKQLFGAQLLWIYWSAVLFCKAILCIFDRFISSPFLQIQSRWWTTNLRESWVKTVLCSFQNKLTQDAKRMYSCLTQVQKSPLLHKMTINAHQFQQYKYKYRNLRYIQLLCTLKQFLFRLFNLFPDWWMK